MIAFPNFELSILVFQYSINSVYVVYFFCLIRFQELAYKEINKARVIIGGVEVLDQLKHFTDGIITLIVDSIGKSVLQMMTNMSIDLDTISCLFYTNIT